MFKKIVIINGSNESGKTTFINYVKKYLNMYPVNVHKIMIDDLDKLTVEKIKGVINDYQNKDKIEKKHSIIFLYSQTLNILPKLVRWYGEDLITLLITRKITSKHTKYVYDVEINNDTSRLALQNKANEFITSSRFGDIFNKINKRII